MSSPPGFSGVRVLIDQSLVFCVVVCRSLFILLSLSFWPPLYCMSFDLRPLVSSFRIFYVVTPKIYTDPVLGHISMKVLTQASLLYSYIYILLRQNIYTDTLYGHIKNEVLVKGELLLYINALGLV